MKIKKSAVTNFTKLCLCKAISNFVMSASFPFWIVPFSMLEFKIQNIPRTLNVIVSEFVGIFTYYFGPFILICMSINRFIAIYFPFSTISKKPFFTNFGIFISILLASSPVFVPKICMFH